MSNKLPWYKQAMTAFFSQWWLKAFGIPSLIGVFFVAYFYLLRNPAYPISVMPLTALDRLISFQPLALPLYVSIWLYVSLPPALLATRRELKFYAMDLGLTCLTGLLVFCFWPNTVPVGDIDWALSPAVGLLKDIDAAGNACPSLHVATAAFSCLWLGHLLRRIGTPHWVMALNWVWFAGICYSTLATRQHVVIDVLAGLALGLTSGWLSLRWRGDGHRHGHAQHP